MPLPPRKDMPSTSTVDTTESQVHAMSSAEEQHATESQPQKRPASNVADVTEPSDRKRRVITTNVEYQRDEPSPSSKAHFINTLAPKFSSPFPIHDPVYIKVESSNYESFFKRVRHTLLSQIFPDHLFTEETIISEEGFILVCRYILKSRVDRVYSLSTNTLQANRIAIPEDIRLCKCLSDVINSVGTVSINNGAILIIPQPEDTPTAAAQQLPTLVTQELVYQFNELIHMLISRNCVAEGFISTEPEGNASWLLSARKATDPTAVADGNIDRLVVKGAFYEWTASEAVLAAIVQNKFDGVIPNVYPTLPWTSDRITNALSMRTSFILYA